MQIERVKAKVGSLERAMFLMAGDANVLRPCIDINLQGMASYCHVKVTGYARRSIYHCC